MLSVQQMRDDVIRPALFALSQHADRPGLRSAAAVELLVGTMLAESVSSDGRQQWVRQLGNGPARGVFQMEPRTYEDHLRWCDARGDRGFRGFVPPPGSDPDRLVYDLRLATVMARIHYWRRPEPLPDTLDSAAGYWKQWYNTPLGAGDPVHFVAMYQRHSGYEIWP